jgi:hypothetical protein
MPGGKYWGMSHRISGRRGGGVTLNYSAKVSQAQHDVLFLKVDSLAM